MARTLLRWETIYGGMTGIKGEVLLLQAVMLIVSQGGEMHGDDEQRCRRRIYERTVAALLVKLVIYVKSNRTTHGWTSASFDAICSVDWLLLPSVR